MNIMQQSKVLAVIVALANSITFVYSLPGLYAAASAGASSSSGTSLGLQPYEKSASPLMPNTNVGLPSDNFVRMLRDKFYTEVKKNPHLYDVDDAQEILNSPHDWVVLRYLNQRSQDPERAYNLLLTTLKWRAKMNINDLDASYFPCELFSMGLIFEYGRTHDVDITGHLVEGDPVIWIRLGALGAVAKKIESIDAKRVVSFAYNSARRLSHSSKDYIINKVSGASTKPRDKPFIADLSARNDKTINFLLRAVAWWIDDWQRRHPPGTRATLVLDFEFTDAAFLSWSIGDFFIGLDDNFPDLFKQVIGFRYKSKIWSLKSPISMMNRIFQSRISSSPETDAKLVFVNSTPEMSNYVPRVDANGFTLWPAHLSGECSAKYEVPQGCSTDIRVLAAEGLYDPSLWKIFTEKSSKFCGRKSS